MSVSANYTLELSVKGENIKAWVLHVDTECVRLDLFVLVKVLRVRDALAEPTSHAAERYAVNKYL